jgi:hypothetical protein
MLSKGGRHGRAQTLSGYCLAVVAALSTTNCSVLIEGDRQQCATTQDCRDRGPAFARSVCSDAICVQDPVWGCVGSVVWPSPPPVPSPEKVTVKLSLSNLLTKAVVPGATARVCGKLDSKCDSPLQSDIVSDAAGILSIQVDKFFDGYFEILFPGMASTMYYCNPPVEKDRAVPFIPLVPFEAIDVFGEVLGMLPKLDRGTVIGLTADCAGTGAEGIELLTDAADEFTKAFYMVQGYPSLNATKTDTSGQGGIANVVSGPRLISGRRTDTGEVIGSVSVQVRPTWITYTSMLPTPNSMQK